MRILIWLFRAVLFLLLLAFAIKNDGIVTVRAFLGAEWQMPLVVVMLSMLAAGVVLGATAVAGSMFMLRREVNRLRKLTPAVSPSTTPLRARPDDAADPL